MNLLWANIFRTKAEETLPSFLATVSLFAGLGRRELALLGNMVHIRRYAPGETVFEEGENGSGLYVVRSGRVQVFLRRGDDGEEELAVLAAGDFFGETTLIAPAPRSASVRALEGAELLGLLHSDFVETTRRHPATAGRILLGLTRILSTRLQATGQELRRLRRGAEPPR